MSFCQEELNSAAGDSGLIRVCRNLNLLYSARHLQIDILQTLSAVLGCSDCEAVEEQIQQFGQSTCSAGLAVQALAPIELHLSGDAQTR